MGRSQGRVREVMEERGAGQIEQDPWAYCGREEEAEILWNRVEG